MSDFKAKMHLIQERRIFPRFLLYGYTGLQSRVLKLAKASGRTFSLLA